MIKRRSIHNIFYLIHNILWYNQVSARQLRAEALRLCAPKCVCLCAQA